MIIDKNYPHKPPKIKSESANLLHPNKNFMNNLMSFKYIDPSVWTAAFSLNKVFFALELVLITEDKDYTTLQSIDHISRKFAQMSINSPNLNRTRSTGMDEEPMLEGSVEDKTRNIKRLIRPNHQNILNDKIFNNEDKSFIETNTKTPFSSEYTKKVCRKIHAN